MINIAELIEKYNTLADQLDGSIETVTTSELHAAQRTEWTWYLKGQQIAYRNVALELTTKLLYEQLCADPVISTNPPKKRKLPG